MIHAMFFSLLIAANPAEANLDCPSLPKLADLQCASNSAGFFYAKESANAQIMASDGLTAWQQFQTYFGQKPHLGSVVSIGTSGSIGAEAKNVLKEAGSSWVLPWLDNQDRAKFIENSIKQQVANQMKGQPQAVIDAAVATAMNQVRGQTKHSAKQKGALKHEIGHLLFMKTFWPEKNTHKGGAHYGGPAPDWLDEVAAILLENDELTKGRREHLFALIDQQSLVPLSKLFSMDHPMKKSKALAEKIAQRGQKKGDSITLIQGAEATKLAGDAANFYTQNRGLIDFLLETSKQPLIFADITKHMANDKSMDDWLKERGKAFHLASDMNGLQAQWDAWLQAKTANNQQRFR